MNFLTLFVSLLCTQSCAHCLYGCTPETGEHMSPEVFTRSLEIARKNRILALNFFGGEPLLNPHFFTMLQTALDEQFYILLATNCRPLAAEGFFNQFLEITKQHKSQIYIITARDKFHLQYFDPAPVIARLQNENYALKVNDYSDQTILISEYNAGKPELRDLNTAFCCCRTSWADNLGVLPDGGWAICPVSLQAFGSIFSHSLEDITKFKQGLPLRFENGCTDCLKDFPQFRREFEIKLQ